MTPKPYELYVGTGWGNGSPTAGCVVEIVCPECGSRQPTPTVQNLSELREDWHCFECGCRFRVQFTVQVAVIPGDSGNRGNLSNHGNAGKQG